MHYAAPASAFELYSAAYAEYDEYLGNKRDLTRVFTPVLLGLPNPDTVEPRSREVFEGIDPCLRNR